MEKNEKNKNETGGNKNKARKIVEGLAAANTVRNAIAFVKAAAAWLVEAAGNLIEQLPDDWMS